MRQLLLILCVSMIISACEKEGSNPISSSEASEQLNVAYGSDPAQKVDIYLPANRNDSTVIALMLHGGSWANGDKTELDSLIPELQRRLPHFAFANANYRLVNGTRNRFPAQENDVNDLVTFLQKKANVYGISGKIVLLGVSAGGHLALLQGYKHNSNVQPKAIVSLFGPTDLADLYTNPVNPITPVGLIGITGYSLEQNPTIYAESSPINYVAESSAPTLILQGAQDSLVPVTQQLRLKAKLEESHIPVELVIYQNAGHGFYGTNLSNALDRISDFLLKYGK
ncbi:MAG TPA: alpha/beta hydrolase [Flavitalea sp.]|nr:alpha/beta hydrolase [Flavitalea sp.]